MCQHDSICQISQIRWQINKLKTKPNVSIWRHCVTANGDIVCFRPFSTGLNVAVLLVDDIGNKIVLINAVSDIATILNKPMVNVHARKFRFNFLPVRAAGVT